MGSTVTNYTLHGKNIVHMTQGSNTLHFWYDAQNRPAIVQFNGTKYGYIVNLQGDVIGLIDSNGTEVVKYVYDAWGKILSTTGSLASTLGAVQPFRYRSYVYDQETGLYYLRSRYYNPTWQRFFVVDSLIISSPHPCQSSLYVYTANNPVNNNDMTGNATNPFPWKSTPFDYREAILDDGTKYQRWYNEYGYPLHERHWTDHHRRDHSIPHDHHYYTEDPSQPPLNEDRKQKNYPSEKWDGEEEWNNEKEKYEKAKKEDDEEAQDKNVEEAILSGVVIAGGCYVAWVALKWCLGTCLSPLTGGASLFLVAIP